MCTVCGCGNSESRIKSHSHHDSTESLGLVHHDHFNDSEHHHHFTSEHVVSVRPETQTAELIQVEKDILEKNYSYAKQNRKFLHQLNNLTLNLVSSPGSGKTTLLVNTIRSLDREFRVSVIEGDQETMNDANRINEAGGVSIQINTGRGCHLDAHMIGHALEQLPMNRDGVLFIENVGNLVCPANFDLGEDHKVVLLSVTEGEDKPIKYPNMFSACDLMLVNKIDLLPYVNFDIDKCVNYAHRINPDIEVILISAENG